MELLLTGSTHVFTGEHMAAEKIKESLLSYMEAAGQKFTDNAVLCIGSDRSTGDSLGPLVGHLLEKKLKSDKNKIYGNLKSPVHARNILRAVDKIYLENTNPLIIAIDAAISKSPGNVGLINTGLGRLTPGAYTEKELPPIGNVYVTGVVNWAAELNHMEILQSTRLGLVMDMAGIIAEGLNMALKEHSAACYKQLL